MLLPIIPVEVPLPRPLLRAVAKGYRRHAFTPCVTGCPRSACKTTHRHGLASGVSPTVRYQSRTPFGSNHHRHHLPRTAISTLQPGSTQLQHYRCCGWQIRFESGGNSGGESRARERAQPIQQRATSKCSSWCAPLFSELCGFPLTVAVFATVATAHISGPLVATDKWPLPYEFIRF